MIDETISTQAGTAQSTKAEGTESATMGQSSVRRKREDGVTLLAFYHFVLAGGFLLGTVSLAIPAMITAIVGVVEDPSALIATFILGGIAFVLMLFCALVLAIGYGLWTQKQWGRMAAIALAVLSLFGFPIGTVIGGLTLWYLLRTEVADQFV